MHRSAPVPGCGIGNAPDAQVRAWSLPARRRALSASAMKPAGSQGTGCTHGAAALTRRAPIARACSLASPRACIHAPLATRAGGEALVAALGVAWRSAWRGSLAQFFLPIEGIATATGPVPLGLRKHAQIAQARKNMQRGAASTPASSLLRLSRARRSGLSAAYFRAPGASDIDCRRRLWLCPHFVPAVISAGDPPSVGVPPASLRRADPATVSHAGIADRARRALRPAVQAAARRPAAAGKPATAAAAAARRTTAAERAAALHMVEMLGGTHAGFHWHHAR
mmetsp:Transcript_26821/g.67952  ORF Transcript_26821/g.67952 Transcript_26821/m.67952 type:complete len:282 (+) Transcript_26821:199-1044(+)